jgi:MHS family proline/betaine transporter-like MFS transporter
MMDTKRAVLAVSIGNTIEWFEIVVYGYFAGAIADQFFPARAPAVSLLAAFAAFGVTFVMRPLGAIFLGAYADRHGRKAALLVSMVLVSAASALIAFVPNYQTIGLAAPAILVLARLIQGFAVGGEFGSATAFLAELDPRRRGFYASLQFASQGASAALATGIGWLLASVLAPSQLDTWGWRVPFLLGLLLGPLGYYVRRSLRDPVEFETAAPDAFPISSLLKGKSLQLFISIGVIAFGTIAIYTLVFLPTFAVRNLGLTSSGAFAAALLTACLQTVIAPLTGAASDRYGRTAVSLPCAALLALAAYPLFTWLADGPTIAKFFVVQVSLGVLAAAYAGPLPALMADLFPIRTRTTALSVSYALSVAVFGGFTPLIHVWLIRMTGQVVAPSHLIVGSAVLALTALWLAMRTLTKP